MSLASAVTLFLLFQGLDTQSTGTVMKMSVKSPNITILDVSAILVIGEDNNRPNLRLFFQDNVAICMPYNMTTSSLEPDFIRELIRWRYLYVSCFSLFTLYISSVSFDTKPMPGKTNIFIFVSLCQEPGFVAPDGQLVPYACGDPSFHKPNPPLPLGSICSNPSPVVENEQLYQYQGPPESGLHFPPGTGIPVGGKEDPKFLVIGFHIANRSLLTNGFSGVTEVDVSVQRHTPGMRSAFPMYAEGFGFVEAHAVNRVSASWNHTKDEEIRVITFYPHWHEMAIKVDARIERSDGQSDLILESDPRDSKGVMVLPDSPVVHMRHGDRLVLTCHFNNTMDVG